MKPASTPQRFGALHDMTSQDVLGLLAGAKSEATGLGAVLRNRHVAVLCEQEAGEHGAGHAADALAASASALGATVAHLRPSSLALHGQPGLHETAQMLGRLYCLVCSEGLKPTVNAGLGRWAGVPVLSDVTAPSHPVRMLADLLVMQEHAGRPPGAITLGLAADAASMQAWQHLAALTGLKVMRLDASAGLAAPAGCNFFMGCAAQCSAAEQPHLMAADPATGDGQCLAHRLPDAQHRLLRCLMTQLCA